MKQEYLVKSEVEEAIADHASVIVLPQGVMLEDPMHKDFPRLYLGINDVMRSMATGEELEGAEDFFNALNKIFDVVFIENCGREKFSEFAAEKKNWLIENIYESPNFIPVERFSSFPSYMNRKEDILIHSGYLNICAHWVEQGGFAIKHEGTYEDTLKVLGSIMEEIQHRNKPDCKYCDKKSIINLEGEDLCKEHFDLRKWLNKPNPEDLEIENS